MRLTSHTKISGFTVDKRKGFLIISARPMQSLAACLLMSIKKIIHLPAVVLPLCQFTHHVTLERAGGRKAGFKHETDQMTERTEKTSQICRSMKQVEKLSSKFAQQIGIACAIHHDTPRCARAQAWLPAPQARRRDILSHRRPSMASGNSSNTLSTVDRAGLTGSYVTRKFCRCKSI